MTPNDHAFDEFRRKYNKKHKSKIAELADDTNTDSRTLETCRLFMRLFVSRIKTYEKEISSTTQKTLNIHAVLISDPTINAFATRHNSTLYFIAINTGVFTILSNSFVDLLTNTNLVAHGIPQNVHTQKIGGSSQLIPFVSLLAASEFLFNHELGHIIYGHTELSFARSGAPLFESSSIQAKKAALSQSMEVDADLHASTSLLVSISRGVLGGIDMKHFFNSNDDLCRISLVAILIMFHMFYGSRVSISTYKMASHPLPEVRMQNLFVRAMQLQKQSVVSFDMNVSAQAIHDLVNELPINLRESLFPCLRTEGSINMISEMHRIRSNEDYYESELRKVAIKPVGFVIS